MHWTHWTSMREIFINNITNRAYNGEFGQKEGEKGD